MRTDVTFQTDRFNTTEVRPYFINDCCFGDDCAQWLAAQLRATGVGEVAEPARLLGGQNDEPLRRLVGAIHESLSTAPEIREVRWRTRTETDRGIGAGSTEPFG